MAGVTDKSVTLRNSDEDVANANNPQNAAKTFSSIYAEGGDITTENDDDLRNKNATKPSSIEMSGVAHNSASSKTPVPGPSGSGATGTTVTVSRSKSERDKKVGHRRVTEGGDVTYKKIQTSQIMGSIQLGVQHAIGGLASKPERDLLMQDFMTVEQTFFPSGGSTLTPAHHYSDFRFKTYAPIAFRYFRDLFGIQPDDFLMSMCSVPMRELSNPGASGSIFYLTDDDEFIVKTVQHKECEFLQKLLPGYYMNLNQNPRTLLPKFFGLFCYQCNSKNVRLAVMNNLLPSSVKMHEKYDLKGSTYKRKANKTEREKAYPTYKDLDFMEFHPEGILLEADTCVALIKTMQRDCRVLESFKIMDYSLLVGIHNLDIAAKEKIERKAKMLDSDEEDEEGEFTPGYGLSRSKSINRHKLVAHSTALESIQADSEPIDADDDVPPGGIPARNAKGERLLLFLGLIDILQSYRLKKKLEHTFKAMIHDGDTVSVHRPGFYAERFMNFMTKSVFRKIPSPLKHSPSKKRAPPMRIRPSGEQGDSGEFAIGALEGSSNTPLPVNTPPPPFQEKAYMRGIGSKGGQEGGSHNQQWNLTQSQSPSRRVVGGSSGGGGGAGSFASSSDHHHHHRSHAQGTSVTDSETVSISEVYVETRMHRSSLSVASSSTTSGVSSSLGHRMPRSPPTGVHDFSRNTSATPTWTEGTPSFTESSSSGGDLGEEYLGYPTTPLRGTVGGRIGGKGADDVTDEHEMTRL